MIPPTRLPDTYLHTDPNTYLLRLAGRGGSVHLAVLLLVLLLLLQGIDHVGEVQGDRLLGLLTRRLGLGGGGRLDRKCRAARRGPLWGKGRIQKKT